MEQINTNEVEHRFRVMQAAHWIGERVVTHQLASHGDHLFEPRVEVEIEPIVDHYDQAGYPVYAS